MLHQRTDYRRHFSQSGERGLLPQLPFDPHAGTEIVQNPGILFRTAHGHLDYRQVQRKRAPILPQARDLPAGPNNLLHSRGEMSRQIGVVLFVNRATA